ncbi:hypothetical protein GCM10027444_25850 [Actinopolyspora lacussalsi]
MTFGKCYLESYGGLSVAERRTLRLIAEELERQIKVGQYASGGWVDIYGYCDGCVRVPHSALRERAETESSRSRQCSGARRSSRRSMASREIRSDVPTVYWRKGGTLVIRHVDGVFVVQPDSATSA